MSLNENINELLNRFQVFKLILRKNDDTYGFTSNKKLM